MKFFEYIFYRLNWWNRKIVKGNLVHDILGISFFHVLNIYSIADLIYILLFTNSDFEPFFKYTRIICLVPFLFNSYYFLNNKYYESIIEKFDKISNEERKRNDLYLIIYMILSVVFIFLLGIIIRNDSATVVPLAPKFGRP